MKKAIITIPERIEGMEVTTNGVHPIVLINALQMLIKHFAGVVANEARDTIGPNSKLQEQYIDRLTRKYLGDPGDFKIDPNMFN